MLPSSVTPSSDNSAGRAGFLPTSGVILIVWNSPVTGFMLIISPLDAPLTDVNSTCPFGSVSMPSAPVKFGVGRTVTAAFFYIGQTVVVGGVHATISPALSGGGLSPGGSA